MNLHNTVTVITGGASGLGRATSEHFAAAGAAVALFDLQPEAGPAFAKQLCDQGHRARFYEVDVTSADRVEEALTKVREELGDIRVCVNCAGIAPAGKTFGRKGPLPLDTFAKAIEINLIGTFNVTRLVAAAMSGNQPGPEGERGVIINTASVAAFDGQMGQVAYSASKAGVVGMTLPLARDLGSLGIRVNTIAPGVFNTPMMQSMPDEVRKPLEEIVQFPKRLGLPTEFARLAEHIADNTYLNGETIRLDGGIRMPAT